MKVSIIVVTYNHEAFVEAALRSVFQQSADFDFEVIISEDCSTDGTRAIVERWSERHADRVRLLLSERNLRTNEVVARGFRAARGEYVALLDGDDYWTSSDKLQLQADFLDANPDLSLCFHNAETVDDKGNRLGRLYTAESQMRRMTLDDLWGGNPFATCTSMFRRAAVPTVPGWFDDFFPITDWPLYVMFAERGGVGYFPAVLGAYRIHAGGLYSKRSDSEKLASVDAFYRRINDCLGSRYDRRIRSAHQRYFYDWVREYAARGERGLARECLRLGRSYERALAPRSVIETAKLLRLVYGRS